MNSVETWSPIALFVYKRIDHAMQTLQALQNNDGASQSELYIFSDGAKSTSDKDVVLELRNLLKKTKGFKKVNLVFRENNMGLGNSIIDGVSSILENHKRVIVLEDDLVTSPDFLNYMNQGLETYKENPRIFSITGSNYLNSKIKNYNFDTFPFYRASSWGWGTWKDRWEKTDWDIKDFKNFINDSEQVKEFNRGGDDMTDTLCAYMKGKIDVWAIRWCYAHFKHNAYCIYPSYSKLSNIGLDGSGENCTTESRRFSSEYHQMKLTFDCPTDHVPETVEEEFRKVHAYNFKKKVKKIIKDIIGYYKV